MMSKWLLLSAFLAFVLGCQLNPLDLRLKGHARLNPDDQEGSLPVVVRIYQLKDANIFQRADFTELWKNDRRVLREPWLDKIEIILAPNQVQRLKIPRKKELGAIGVMAIFRKPEGKKWRIVVPVVAPWLKPKLDLHIQVKGNQLVLLK